MRLGIQTDIKSSEKCFPNQNLASLFRRIDRKTFEPGKFFIIHCLLNWWPRFCANVLECRPLLNQLNAGPNSLVKSFPCYNLKVGSREVLKPRESQYDQLYIDFNLGPKLIRVSTITCRFWPRDQFVSGSKYSELCILIVQFLWMTCLSLHIQVYFYWS